MIYSRHPHAGTPVPTGDIHNSAALHMCWLSVTPSGDGGFPLLISSNSSRGWVTQGDTSSATTRRIPSAITRRIWQELFFSESEFDKSYFFSLSSFQNTILHQFKILSYTYTSLDTSITPARMGDETRWNHSNGSGQLDLFRFSYASANRNT